MNKVEYIYVDDDSQTKEAIDFLRTCDRLGYDTEAQGLKLIGGFSKILLMQLGTDEITYVFDPRKIDTEPLREILESQSILKILHNAKYDYQATKIGTGISLCNIFDTMLAQRLLTSGLIEDGKGSFVAAGFRDKNKKSWHYKSLSDLTQRYLGITLDKSVRNTFIDHPYDRDFTPAQLQYAADDIIYLPSLCDILSEKLVEHDLIDTAILEFQFVAPVSEMEINGASLDKDLWRSIIGQAKKQADSLTKEMSVLLAPLSEQNTLFGTSAINIKSPEQLLGAFHKLGFSELENTDEKSLKAVDHPLAKFILAHRGYTKLISTYGEAILRKINRTTGRLHFVLDQLGADTGRLSSRDPNIQNIPQDKEDQDVKISFRDCFVAPSESKILTADYSQCIEGSELISIPQGLVRMDEFFPGLRIPSFSGDFAVSSDYHCSKGVKEVLELKTQDGFTLQATPDHLIKVVDKSGLESWKEARDLGVDDALVLSRDWIEDSAEGIFPNSELCILLGYWVGDGSFSSGGIQFAKSEDKYEDLYTKLNTICLDTLGKPLKNYPTTSSWDLIGLEYKRMWESIGFSRTKAADKNIPASILGSGRQCIANFLKGLFEADGWVSVTSEASIIAFSSRSSLLAKQVQLLLLGLGIFSKLHSYEEESTLKGVKYKGVQHRVSIVDSFNASLFRKEVGFISKEKSRLLDSFNFDKSKSYSDYIYMTEEDIQGLISCAKNRLNWTSLRRIFFANYYNTERGIIRNYPRNKLNRLLDILSTSVPYSHKAYSSFKQSKCIGPKEVFDISVPAQKMFVAGGAFVHNCELRILAEVSKDRQFLEIFHSGEDLHIITAKQVFGFSEEDLSIFLEVKKKDVPGVDLTSLFTPEQVSVYKTVGDYRNKTKVINFGLIYGMNAWSLAERFKIPQGEAEEILENYFGTYSGIKRWLNENAYETISNRYAKTIIGRKKFFHLADPGDEEKFRRSKGATRRMGNNHVIQGTNADITKEALILLHEEYKSIPGAKILFTVHDEIISEAPESVAEYVAEVKAEAMRKAFHRFIKTVPVGKDDKVSVTIADHWSK